MSSYELLELLDQMPARGAFRTAIRGGELCSEDQMWRHGINEMTRLRAMMNAVHGGKTYTPIIFLSLDEIQEMREEQLSTEDARDNFYQFADRSYELEEEMSQNSNSY